jgi:hypothetical protein
MSDLYRAALKRAERGADASDLALGAWRPVVDSPTPRFCDPGPAAGCDTASRPPPMAQ